jgi:hypothetical protein
VALARDDPRADSYVAACDRAVLDEAEPRQHRHLTRAWLAQQQGRWSAAADEIDAARGAFVFPPDRESVATPFGESRGRTGDHTPHLLMRFARSAWVGPGAAKIDAWLKQLDLAPSPAAPPPRAKLRAP